MPRPTKGAGYHDTWRGIAYEHRGDHDRAIADFDKAIRLKPDYGYAHYGRGSAYAAKGDPAKALSDFRVAAQLIPASDQLHGKALAHVDQLEKQLAEVESAARLR